MRALLVTVSRFPHLLASLLLLTALGLATESAQAQGRSSRESLVFSGFIVDGDSAVIPGVHIYIPVAGRGTISDPVGFFAMSALPGDTVVISAIGFSKRKLVIPTEVEGTYNILVDMKVDDRLLEEIDIYPFPSEAMFREAFLALELPETYEERLARTLNPQLVAQMTAAMPMSPNMNHRMFMDQQFYQTHNRQFAPSFSILNPVAWSNFIQSVKRGDLKSNKPNYKRVYNSGSDTSLPEEGGGR